MKYLSLFSGIEAATVAWESFEWEPIAFCEIDDFPSAVLKNRFPDVPNLGDVTKIDWSDYNGKIDIIVGGSPCQSFSIAGKREGLRGESALMFEYIRAVREVRPKYFIWENVPHALASENGNAFRQLISEMDELGYGLAWRVLDAQFFGVPQRRKRIFLVGCFGRPECAAEILFEPECLQRNFETSKNKRKSLADRIRKDIKCYCLQGSMIGRKPENGPQGSGINEELSFTLNTIDHHAVAIVDEPEIQNKNIRKLTPKEWERLQGFPDDWTNISYKGKDIGECKDALRYKALGNSMAIPVMKWIGSRIDKQVKNNSLIYDSK